MFLSLNKNGSIVQASNEIVLHMCVSYCRKQKNKLIVANYKNLKNDTKNSIKRRVKIYKNTHC